MIFKRINPIRFFLAAVIGFVLMFSSAVPAMAIGTAKSNPSEGEAQLSNIQKQTDKVADADNPSPSMKKSQAKTDKGINEVQGAADKGKMLSPSNTKNATTVKEEVGDFLEDLTGNN